MSLRFLRGLRFIIFAGIALAAHSARAADTILISFENTTGVPARDLHITFTGSGGNVFVDPNSVFAPGCPVPAVPSNPPVVTDEVVIDFGIECVPPGNSVTFIVRTANGPLAFSSGFWTNGYAVPIGPASVATSAPIPSPGPNQFSPIKFFSWYIGGITTYTDYITESEDQFVRECCRSSRWCFAEVYFCPVPNRFDQFFEIGPWDLLTTVHTYTPSRYTRFSWIIWGIQPEMNPKPKGPPQGRVGLPYMFDRADMDLDPRYSDDGGQTFRRGADFTSAFLAFSDSLEIHPTSIGPTPVYYPVPLYFQELGQRWAAAMGTLSPLLTEIDNVRNFEPSLLLNEIYSDVANAQAASSAISAQLSTGNPTNKVPFENLRNSLISLGNNIDQVHSSARFDNAAGMLYDAAYYLALAADEVNGTGWDDTVKVANFEYAMTERVPGALHHFGKTMWPHIVVKVSTPEYGWYLSSLEGAHVVVTKQPSNVVFLDRTLPIHDTGEIVVPAGNLLDGEQIRINVKLPTFLSIQTDMAYHDGARSEHWKLIAGDANGDDCISIADLALIGANQGQGGWNSVDATPTSDVNGDGVVDPLDSNVLQGKIGLCGPQTVTGVGPALAPRLANVLAFPNPSSGTPTIQFTLAGPALVSITLYNVRGELVSTIAEQQFSAGLNEMLVGARDLPSGVYFCRLRATGLSAGMGTFEEVSRITVLK